MLQETRGNRINKFQHFKTNTIETLPYLQHFYCCDSCSEVRTVEFQVHVIYGIIRTTNKLGLQKKNNSSWNLQRPHTCIPYFVSNDISSTQLMRRHLLTQNPYYCNSDSPTNMTETAAYVSIFNSLIKFTEQSCCLF